LFFENEPGHAKKKGTARPNPFHPQCNPHPDPNNLKIIKNKTAEKKIGNLDEPVLMTKRNLLGICETHCRHEALCPRFCGCLDIRTNIRTGNSFTIKGCLKI